MHTAPHDYFIFVQDINDESCLVNELPRSLNKTSWPASTGDRMADNYPSGIRLDMARRHRGIVVPDVIPNTLLKYLITDKLKVLLEKEAGVEIEFLPFTLLNHKGRVAAQDCFIANVIGSHDCVDRTRTLGEESIISPGQFEALSRLQLAADKIPDGVKLFRPSAMPRLLIIRDDLRATLERNGITGARYIAMGESCHII